MVNQLMENIGIKRTRGWVVFGLVFIMLCVGCMRDEYMQINNSNGILSINNVEVAKSIDWSNKSVSQSSDGTSYVKLGDSLLIYARVEVWDADTTTIVTRGTPVMNMNDLSDIRMNLYTMGTSNWTSSFPITEPLKISRSGKVHVTTPLYNWSNKTDKVTLLTYTPLPSATNGLVEGVNGNTVVYSVPINVISQPDFCATIPDVDVVNSDGTKHVRSLTLYHHLTAIGFSLNGWNVKVSKIEVSGVVFKGTYALRTSIWSLNAVGVDSRMLGISTNKVPMDYYNTNTNWTDITRSNGYLMMIPQDLTNKATVQITYTDAAGKEQVMTAMLADMSSGKWNAGDKITYCIQLETAPSIGTEAISLYMPWKAGYTTRIPLPFVAKDPQDRYTFNWRESWNIIHRGQEKVNNLSGGAASGWYTGAIDNTPIWFFTKENNPSISSSRTSVVTLDAWRTVDRTFNVMQGMRPSITVDGMPSTSVVMPIVGGTYTVTVKSNYAWETTLSNITMNPSSGAANMEGQRVTMTIPPSKDNEGVVSAIFKTTNDNKVPDLVSIASYVYTREVNLKIDPTTSGEIIIATGQQYPISVMAGSAIAWIAVPGAGVTLNKQQGIGNSAMNITIAPNPSLTTRRNVKVDFKIGSKIVATWSGVQEALKEYHFDSHNGWAGSNIYWDGSKLTFDDYGVTTREQYMGVYFFWGSLVAVSPSGEWSPKRILFAPGDKNWKGEDWSPQSCVSVYDIPTLELGGYFENKILTRHHLLERHSPNRNVGDMCKYMSDNKLAPATTGNKGWRMPTAAEYISQGLDVNKVTKVGVFDYTPGNSSGTTKIPSGFRSGTPHKGAFFPASGVMSEDFITMQGTNGRYWSGTLETTQVSWGYSFGGESYYYYLPERFYLFNIPGQPIRCVRNK